MNPPGLVQTESSAEDSTRSVVVTGGASGIGRAIAERLLADRRFVVVVDLCPLDWGVADQRGGRLCSIVADVRDEGWAHRAAEIAESRGLLDGWVNNAAIELDERADVMTDEAMKAQIDVNLVGTLTGIRTAVTRMSASGKGGSIVTVGSIQSLTPLPGAFVYSATKAAVSAATRQVAIEFATHGIRANCVLPGAIRTPLSERFWHTSADPDAAESADARLSPMGRVGESPEVADAVAWLLSDQASFVTGHELVVDGGASVRLIAGSS